MNSDYLHLLNSRALGGRVSTFRAEDTMFSLHYDKLRQDLGPGTDRPLSSDVEHRAKVSRPYIC